MAKKKKDDKKPKPNRSIKIPIPPTIPHGSPKSPKDGKMNRSKPPMKEKRSKDGS